LFYFSGETAALLFKKAGLRCSVASRHEYTLKNFLNWYFLGTPQPDFVTGLTGSRFFAGDSEFERKMDSLLAGAEAEFKRISAKTNRGDNLCVTGWK
jgi:hypothetical protein